MHETRSCAGIRRDGGRCTVSVVPPQMYCWWHDPSHASQRSELASKAARSKRGPAVTEIVRKIREVMDSVLEGTVDRSDASVFFQGAGVLIKAIEQARRVKETEELAAEVEEVKATLRRYKGTWGA